MNKWSFCPMGLIVKTHSPEETFGVGKTLGRIVFTGAVFALTGPLGSGKTRFVQGLARGLDVPERYYITSPSYTLINEYPGNTTLVHADLYRLTSADDIESLGLYEMLHADCVVAIEWADKIPQKDLADHVAVDFKRTDERTRRIRFMGYGQRCHNLLRELEKKMKESIWG
jgi:tRNA threonylcarbamoyladenosine biosynthesis protein TsaE